MAQQSQDSEVPPPLQDLPDAKTRKYDRQLRLWGANGQVALENTHILLINRGSGVTGVEALKNLVLPGIGRFTILDDATVDEADLGVNFFLNDASLGKSRADETVKMLRELNPDVQGEAITDCFDHWMHANPDLSTYTIILVAAPVHFNALSLLQDAARKLDLPILHFHCLGYYSHFSLCLPTAFPIVDTHPDPASTTDLRLMKPWPALSDFAKKKTENMANMNGEEFAHIPWVCLLLHYLSQWQAENGGKLPVTYKEKSAFRELVRSGSATEENFDEAAAAVLKSLNPPTAPSNVREIFADADALHLTSDTPPFWLIAKAVSNFYSEHNELPLPGAVPDMKARSDTYIQLQSIYKTKAREDCAEVTSTVRALEDLIQRPAHLKVHDKEIENFCKGAAHISLVRGRPFRVVQPGQPLAFGERAKALAQDLTNPESLLGIYLSVLAWDKFVAEREQNHAAQVVPGATDATWQADAIELRGRAVQISQDLLSEAEMTVELTTSEYIFEKICVELARSGGGELHNIASLTGGLIAQEVIKVITEQYVPVDNTCIFDGITSRAYALRA